MKFKKKNKDLLQFLAFFSQWIQLGINLLIKLVLLQRRMALNIGKVSLQGINVFASEVTLLTSKSFNLLSSSGF